MQSSEIGAAPARHGFGPVRRARASDHAPTPSKDHALLDGPALDRRGKKDHRRRDRPAHAYTYFRGGHQFGLNGYREEVGKSWTSELELVEDLSIRSKLAKRLKSFMACGQFVKVRSCTGCHTDRPGSGTFRGTRTCKTKACPICSRIRSETYDDFADRAFDLMLERKRADPSLAGYSWQYVTVTTKYDPYSEDDATVGALRYRALACARACALAWKNLLKHPGAGLLRSIECGKRGHVHANLVYWGPKIARADIEKVTQEADPCIGYSHCLTVGAPPKKKGEGKRNPYLPDDEAAEKSDKSEDEKEAEIKKGLKRVARYVSKGLDHDGGDHVYDEDFWSNTSAAQTTDPLLAARWEIATYKTHLSQKYGALRGIELDEDGTAPESALENDHGETCACCGVVGRFEWKRRRAQGWLDKCAAKGKRGIHGTPKEWVSIVVEPDD